MSHVISDDVLMSLPLRLAQQLPVIPPFKMTSRSAVRVGVVEGCEVWVLAWLPGQGTDLHDHGGLTTPTPAAFAVASGRLTQFTVKPGYFPRLESRDVTCGEVVAMDPSTIHGVVNSGLEPAVSVHVYGPRLSAMRRYLFDETGLSLSVLKRAGEDWLTNKSNGRPIDGDRSISSPSWRFVDRPT